jgi:hypothetical protein
MADVLGWLREQVTQLAVPPQRPQPADMTDKQLQQDIHDVGGRLLNALGSPLQRSFAEDAQDQDSRLPHPVIRSARGHVLMFFIQAYDSFGLALRGLNAHATSSALGPIRNIVETLALMRWLLEDSDPDQVRSRAYRLTLDIADQYRQQWQTLDRLAADSPEKEATKSVLVNAENRLRASVAELADQDGVAVADAHGSASRLIERYLPDHGGYLLYALLSSAGVHPGAARATFFYAQPDSRIIDFDFKGMFVVRAYWIGQATSLFLELGNVTAPVLGWQEWNALSDTTERQLRPLAEEAEKRFLAPLQRAAARLQSVKDSGETA